MVACVVFCCRGGNGQSLQPFLPMPSQGPGQRTARATLMVCSCALTTLLASAPLSLGCLTITRVRDESSTKGVPLGDKSSKKTAPVFIKKII